ncbi:uncharacterized protein LOC108346724 isoform X3 [Vigna angularis]|uniref:uncharacterized protein LOC108346724 isoform X3 n=1 Tax=Phaseolus angularis TaxID=3914 RepID=UPI0022B3C2C8|nr:uncharacterized protein LOC108346724 isoform X3 [Vigna angularis]
MDELPREIGKLVNLKLLKLHYCHFERSNVFEVIRSCSSLEELHLLTKKFFKDCHLQLPNYQRFCIVEHSFGKYVYPEWFLRNSLHVDNAMKIFSQETLKNLVQKAEILRLSGPLGVWKNLIPDIIFPEDESTSNLMEIELADNSQLTCLIDNNDSLVQSALSGLVMLRLERMKNLKEICKISLCKLRCLCILHCPMLTSLFELSTTQSLSSLETLRIGSCEQLKSIIRDENKWKDSGEEIVDTHNNNKSTISIFPNLTTLHVSECHLLQFVLPVTQKIPKLEDTSIGDCDGLKYLFGRYQHEHEEEDLHQELKDVIIKDVYLWNLPNFVDIFQKCDESLCSLVKKSTSKDESKGQIESKSITYKVLHWIHKYKNKGRTTKIPFDSKDQLQDSSLSMVNEPNANDVIAQNMSVELKNLNDTSKILFTLQNVTVLRIESCEKVEVLFCASMLECLPYLGALNIYRCNELKQIIDEDAKNQRKPFFPRLKALIIRECNKLKCIFPVSTSKMVPMLEALLIMEASMLEEVFEGNSDEKVEIPNLKTAGFVELPSLRQKIEFLTVKHGLVRNCPKPYISSFPQDLKHFSYSLTEYFKNRDLHEQISGALDNLKPEEIGNENPRREDSGVEAASCRGSELTSSQNNANQSTLAKIDEDNKQREDVVKQSKERVEEEQLIVVGKASSMPISPTDFPLDKTHSPENDEEEMAIPSSNLKTEPPISKDVNDGDFQRTSNSVFTNSQNTNSTEIADDLHEDSKPTEIRSQNEMTKAKEYFSIDAKAEVFSGTDFPSSQETKKTCEDGTASPYEKTIALSTDSESEHGEAQISVPFSVVNIEVEDVGVEDIQKASPEKLVEITQDSSSGYSVRRELEQLISKKHLGSENLALLSNFLVKHPSLRLADDAMSERYKGFAYTCLAELLKFLQSHSVFMSSHPEFVELLKDLRNCGFNKDWLDDVERLKLL